MNKAILKLCLLISVFALGIGAKGQTQTYTVTFGSVTDDDGADPTKCGTVSAKAGATSENVQSISSGASVNHGYYVSLTAEPKEGYKFGGWYREANLQTKLTDNIDYTISSLTANVSAYARFVNANDYVVASSLTDCDITFTTPINKSIVRAGQTVSFTLSCNVVRAISPSDVSVKYEDENKVIKSVALTYNENNKTFSFTMPAYNVVIYAVAKATFGTEDDIVITSDNNANPIKGNVSGDIYVVLNERKAEELDVYFDNVILSSGHSLIISSRQSGCRVNLYFKGTCVLASSTKAGIIINPNQFSALTQRPVTVAFSTVGQSDLRIGTTGETKAVVDELLISKQDDIYESAITYFSKIGKFKYSSNNNDWTFPDITTDDFIDDFATYCKENEYVSFVMNQTSDTRSAPGGWITACYPYDCTVSGGSVYTVFGRILWEQGDSEMTESRGELGKLKHLILRLKEDDGDANSKHKMEAGKAYFIKKEENGGDITFTITGNTYVETPIVKYSFVGSYTKKQMESDSYFLNGSQILEVRSGSVNNVLPYRAYFQCKKDDNNNIIYSFTSVDKIDDVCQGVPLYVKSDDDSYIIYGRSTGTGGTDWNTNWNKVKLRFTDEFAIVDDEETTSIIEFDANDNVISSQYYDLLGRKVKTPQKGGLYIINGKKVLY